MHAHADERTDRATDRVTVAATTRPARSTPRPTTGSDGRAGRVNHLGRPSSVRLASLAQRSRGATTSGRWRRARRRSGLDGKGKGTAQRRRARRFLSLPFLTYSAPGGLRQDPGRTAESSAEATTCGHEGAACVCCCRRMRDAVTSTRWRDWRCSCGRSGRKCGCARRPTGRSGRPTCQREGNER
jgi:hypothetical protein